MIKITRDENNKIIKVGIKIDQIITVLFIALIFSAIVFSIEKIFSDSKNYGDTWTEITIINGEVTEQEWSLHDDFKITMALAGFFLVMVYNYDLLYNDLVPIMEAQLQEEEED